MAINVRNNAHTSYTVLFCCSNEVTRQHLYHQAPSTDGRLFRRLHLLLLSRPAGHHPKCLCSHTPSSILMTDLCIRCSWVVDLEMIFCGRETGKLLVGWLGSDEMPFRDRSWPLLDAVAYLADELMCVIEELLPEFSQEKIVPRRCRAPRWRHISIMNFHSSSDEQHRCMGWNSHGVSKVSVRDAAGVKQVEHEWLNVWDSRWENW